MRWPGRSWRLSIEDFVPGCRTIDYAQDETVDGADLMPAMPGRDGRWGKEAEAWIAFGRQVAQLYASPEPWTGAWRYEQANGRPPA